MKRDIENELLLWKEKEGRTPLIIRGARQVGKSYTIEEFGKKYFDNTLVVNFEEKKEAIHCFASLDVQEILKLLGFLYGVSIIPGSTLLFLDEIQICPQAIKALRYFKEKLPSLHVIAAGSLLEFVLEDEKEPISFPVGRVRFLNMKPLSFLEFLDAIGQGQWRKALQEISLNNPLPAAFHAVLLQFVRDYYLVGGMPASVNFYVQSSSFVETMHEQKALLDMYRLDLVKYGKRKELAHLETLFESAPNLVAKHFRYSKIDPESSHPSREYKYALRKLNQAGLIYSVHATSANGVPLKAEENAKKFKLLFLDIGLLQCALELNPEESLSLVNSGVLAEQFVGQELLVYGDYYMDAHLYFWETEKQGSAEVDYVTTYQGNIIPVEVKAGKSGRLASLQQFLERKSSKLGLHISLNELSYKNQVLSVPFYLIKEIPRLVEELLSQNNLKS